MHKHQKSNVKLGSKPCLLGSVRYLQNSVVIALGCLKIRSETLSLSLDPGSDISVGIVNLSNKQLTFWHWIAAFDALCPNPTFPYFVIFTTGF
jgi:hypothetical protein